MLIKSIKRANNLTQADSTHYFNDKNILTSPLFYYEQQKCGNHGNNWPLLWT